MKNVLKASARLIIECCALYLLSVLFLLGGVASAMTSPLLGGTGVAADLPLWGVMNLYDVAVLLVIGFLFAKPERREDGYYLAMAAVALTMDPTLFNNRFYTHDPSYGLILNSLGLVLALAKITVLSRVCGVPLSRSALVSTGAALGLIYMGGAPFNLEAFTADAAYFSLLCWAPLVLAFLAPGPEYFEVDPADPVEVASIRTLEFRFVALILPFLGIALHLWQMPRIYDLPTQLGLLSPWLLAMILLSARFYPESIEEMLPAYAAGAGLSFAFVIASPDLLQVSLGSTHFTSLRLLLLGHVLVGAYLSLRSRLRVLEVYTLTVSALFLAGGTPEEIAQAFAGTYGWTVLSLVGAAALYRSRSFESAVAAWASFSGLLVSLYTGTGLRPETFHLAGVGALVLTHCFPGKAEEYAQSASGLVLALLGHAYLGTRGYHPGSARLLLGAEVLLLAVGAWFTPYLRYRLPLAGGLLAATDQPGLRRWAGDNQAWLGLGASFVLLGSGAWVSLHKGDLLAQLEDSSPEIDLASLEVAGEDEENSEDLDEESELEPEAALA